jgi:uncharacterized protein YbbC (DUF1343 family)
MLVLDRPNPLGGDRVEGNLLSEELYSFVGPYGLPMRHGLTMGELALLFKDVYGLDLDLEVLPMAGWHRETLWADTGLRWVMPSPNMPGPDTAHVYPGQVLWEGTNVSEGRGTCRPFEMFGAPFIHPEGILERLPAQATQGALLRPFSFRPTFHKWEDQICPGFMIFVMNYRVFKPYFLSIALLSAVLGHARDAFEWRTPPYEYEYERLPIDLILGDTGLREAVEDGVDPLELQEGWKRDELAFLDLRGPYLLYK